MAQARTVVAQVPDRQGRRRPPATGCRRRTCRASARTTRTSGSSAKFDPAAPSELLYDGTGPDAKIVGLSYLVFNRGGPPEGFAGANDHWHQHNANGGLCFNNGGIVIGGEEHDRAKSARRAAARSASSPTSGWRTRGSCPASSAAGACSPASAPSSAARSAGPPGTELRGSVADAVGSRSASSGRPAGASAGGGSPSRRGLRARRASRCPGPSRARAAPS